MVVITEMNSILCFTFLCSVASCHEAMGTRKSAAWSLGKWSSLIATILYLRSSGENDSQLCNLGGAVFKILSRYHSG